MNCLEMRNQIAQMPVSELKTLDRSGHLSECASCGRYLDDMLHISSGLDRLAIPRPFTMSPPIPAPPVWRARTMTLLAATVAMLIMGALGAFVYKNYIVAEDSSGPGTRTSLFYTTEKDGTKKAKNPRTGRLEREQSTPLPSSPSRN